MALFVILSDSEGSLWRKGFRSFGRSSSGWHCSGMYSFFFL